MNPTHVAAGLLAAIGAFILAMFVMVALAASVWYFDWPFHLAEGYRDIISWYTPF